MLDDKIVTVLKSKFSHLHPLLLHRSIDRARSNGDLFDILDSVPTMYPIVWNEADYRWTTTTDLFQSREFTMSGS